MIDAADRASVAAFVAAWDGPLHINEHLRPLRQRRQAFATDPGYLRQVLLAGNARANQIAEQTLQQVRSVMDMGY